MGHCLNETQGEEKAPDYIKNSNAIHALRQRRYSYFTYSQFTSRNCEVIVLLTHHIDQFERNAT